MMTNSNTSFGRLSLFTQQGERKYLNRAERALFLNHLHVLKQPTDQTFCEMIFWTGCRPSEALALTPLHIDLDEELVVIRSLKKRGKKKGQHFRPVPLPTAFIKRLDHIHHIRDQQRGHDHVRLWPFSRTTAWHRIHEVMNAAGISGARACGRGLRHAYGVHAAMSDVPETRIKKWLGHEHLETTETYLNMASPEDRQLASRMWR